MIFDVLNTERLTLKLISPEVLNYAHEHFTNSELKEFYGFDSDETLIKEQKKFAKGFTTFNKSFTYFHLINNRTQKIIGWCGYHTWYLDHQRAEIGYEIYDSELRSKGFMSEALTTILAYGFNKMNLNRIEAFIHPENIPSLKSLEKFGFKLEGCLKEHYYNDGIAEDSAIYALLKNQYKELTSTTL